MKRLKGSTTRDHIFVEEGDPLAPCSLAPGVPYSAKERLQFAVSKSRQPDMFGGVAFPDIVETEGDEPITPCRARQPPGARDCRHIGR